MMIPRYSYFPRMSFWNQQGTLADWCEDIDFSLQEKEQSWALYIHFPYCERLCHFCGCNTTITSDHGVEKDYIEHLFCELDFYLKSSSYLSQRACSGIYIGGGTPTFFSPDNWKFFFSELAKRIIIDPHLEGFVEVDPRVTVSEHLDVFSNYGVKNILLGVQDIDEKVLSLSKRSFPLSSLQKKIRDLSDREFVVGIELILGLPGQTDESVQRLLEEISNWPIARIHSYDYIDFPWNRKKWPEEIQLPKEQAVKRWQDELKYYFEKQSWHAFAPGFLIKNSDSLFTSEQDKIVRRSCGYWTKGQRLLLGLGVSAISESQGMLKQNEKVLPIWQREIKKIPMASGALFTQSHRLSLEEKKMSSWIQKVLCHTNLDMSYFFEKETDKEQWFSLIDDWKGKDWIVKKNDEWLLTDKGVVAMNQICYNGELKFVRE